MYTRGYLTSCPGSNRCEDIKITIFINIFIYWVGGPCDAATPLLECDCKTRCSVKILLVHGWYCAEYFCYFLKKCSCWKQLGKIVTLFMNKEYCRLFMSNHFSNQSITYITMTMLLNQIISDQHFKQTSLVQDSCLYSVQKKISLTKSQKITLSDYD